MASKEQSTPDEKCVNELQRLSRRDVAVLSSHATFYVVSKLEVDSPPDQAQNQRARYRCAWSEPASFPSLSTRALAVTGTWTQLFVLPLIEPFVGYLVGTEQGFL